MQLRRYRSCSVINEKFKKTQNHETDIISNTIFKPKSNTQILSYI